MDGKALIQRYYSELWNQWSVQALDELISPRIVFRGSIGTVVNGINEFRAYVNRIRSAFPDFSNQIHKLIAEGEEVVARITYTGTHRVELLGFRATGARVSYEGVAVFRIREGKIVEGYVLGDTENLKRQLLAAEVAMAAKQLPVSFGIALASEQEQQWAAELMSRSEPWVTLRRNYESALQSLRNPTHVLFVAQNSSAEPTGFLLIHPEGVAGSPYIKSIGVDEPFRNAGIGTALLHFAESLFAPRARHIFICSSSFHPRARALYERRGYKLVGELKDYVIPGASELLMHKTLRPPESSGMSRI